MSPDVAEWDAYVNGDIEIRQHSVFIVDSEGEAQQVKFEARIPFAMLSGWLKVWMATERTRVVNVIARKRRLAQRYPGLYPKIAQTGGQVFAAKLAEDGQLGEWQFLGNQVPDAA